MVTYFFIGSGLSINVRCGYGVLRRNVASGFLWKKVIGSRKMELSGTSLSQIATNHLSYSKQLGTSTRGRGFAGAPPIIKGYKGT